MKVGSITISLTEIFFKKKRWQVNAMNNCTPKFRQVRRKGPFPRNKQTKLTHEEIEILNTPIKNLKRD